MKSQKALSEIIKNFFVKERKKIKKEKLPSPPFWLYYSDKTKHKLRAFIQNSAKSNNHIYIYDNWNSFCGIKEWQFKTMKGYIMYGISRFWLRSSKAYCFRNWKKHKLQGIEIVFK